MNRVSAHRFRARGPGYYPSDSLKELNRSFTHAAYKLWNLRTGNVTKAVAHLTLKDVIAECARKVVQLVDAGVLSSAEIPNLQYIQTLEGLDQRHQGRDRATPEVPRGLPEQFVTVTHRIRGNAGSQDKRCKKAMARTLEECISSAFSDLEGSVFPHLVLGPRFFDAVAVAWQAHAGQHRKGTQRPYFSHTLGVASLVIEAGADEDEAIAALLHDVPRTPAVVRPCSASVGSSETAWRTSSPT